MKIAASLLSVLLFAPATAAVGADLSTQAAPLVAPSPSWTGFHIGLNAGGVFGNSTSLSSQTGNLWTPPGPADFLSAPLLSGATSSAGVSGFIGGGQIGYDWQGAYAGYNLVAGLEADIQGVAGTGGSQSRWLLANGRENGGDVKVLSNQQGNSVLSYLGTVRGRVGLLVTPTLLLYGTGGLAYGGVNVNIQNVQIMQWDYDSTSGVVLGRNATSRTMAGWTAGGGVEWQFMSNWSAKVEYLRYDLGRAGGSVVNGYFEPGNDGVQSITNYSGRVSGNIVRAGVNYHFSWGAPASVVAKY